MTAPSEPTAPSADEPPPEALQTLGRFRTVLLRPGTLVPERVRRSAAFLFGATLFATIVSLFAANFLFAEAAGLIGIAFLAFSLQEELVGILEENRDVIWVKALSPARANLRLSFKFLAIFLGMVFGFGGMAALLPEATVRAALGPQLGGFVTHAVRIQGIDFGSPGPVARHNAVVLLGCFLGSFFFRSGGALLFFGWNASVWGAVYGFIIRNHAEGRALYAAKVCLAVLPHVLIEGAAYVLAALAGIFLSKALAKYGMETPVFRRVARASLLLLVLGLLLVGAAAYVEAEGTPRLARWLFQE